MKLEEHHPHSAGHRRKQGKVKHRALFHLAALAQFFHVVIRHTRRHATRQPDQPTKPLIRIQCRTQQQSDADKAQNQGTKHAAMQTRLAKPAEINGEEKRRGIGQSHRRCQRQHRNRIEVHQQGNKAAATALELNPPMRGRDQNATETHQRKHHHQRNRTTVKNDFGRRKRLGSELHADTHAGEKEAGRNHPERLHRLWGTAHERICLDAEPSERPKSRTKARGSWHFSRFPGSIPIDQRVLNALFSTV